MERIKARGRRAVNTYSESGREILRSGLTEWECLQRGCSEIIRENLVRKRSRWAANRMAAWKSPLTLIGPRRYAETGNAKSAAKAGYAATPKWMSLCVGKSVRR